MRYDYKVARFARDFSYFVLLTSYFNIDTARGVIEPDSQNTWRIYEDSRMRAELQRRT